VLYRLGPGGRCQLALGGAAGMYSYLAPPSPRFQVERL
jgi:hypothetical protein